MKKFIFLFALLSHFTTFSQNPTNSFEGIFETTSKESGFEKFHFNGKGHVMINDTIPAMFVQEKNILFISSKLGDLFFKTEPNKIVRFDAFDNKLDYLKKNIAQQNSIIFDSSEVDPKLMFELISYEYDLNNYEASLKIITDSSEYLAKTEDLCKRGLDIACESYFGAILLDDFRDSFVNDIDFEITENKKLETICELYTKTNPGKAYFLLSSYFASIKNKEKALEYFELAKKNADTFLLSQLNEFEKLLK